LPELFGQNFGFLSIVSLDANKKGENPRKIILTATAKRRKKVDVAKNPVAPLMKGLEKANSKNKERVFQFPGAGDALCGLTPS